MDEKLYMNFKIFYLVEQTNIWNFSKDSIFGKYVGSDEYGNRYYKSKSNERWVVYFNNIEATKITSDWYLWIHHTTDKIQTKKI